MLGWEFPPFFAGGAGIVSSELSKALNNRGVNITFVMPTGPESEINKLNLNNSMLKIKIPKDIKYFKVKKIKSLLGAYDTPLSYEDRFKRLKSREKKLYGSNLKEEVERFSYLVEQYKDEDFDVIHAHDWVTFLAGARLKEITGKPLAIHVHITEFDKSGGTYADPYTYKVEKLGMEKADKIITVSHKIKERCIQSYGAESKKIVVVHNAATKMKDLDYKKSNDEKIVLFAGRVTMQKGPEYFVDAAKKVLEKESNVKFVIAGTGDMLDMLKNKVRHLGIEDKFNFTGFYTRDQAEEIFGSADVFVMPSISEPFGIVPFEAQIKKTPTIISKQSGISEMLNHVLKVDFWDINNMASKILALLHYKELHQDLSKSGYLEAKSCTWDKPADKCLKIYKELIA